MQFPTEKFIFGPLELLNVLLFLAYCYGLGYTLTRFMKEHTFETTVARIGIGLGALPVLGVVLNTLHIPIDYRIILLLALIVPLVDFASSPKGLKLPSEIPRPEKRFFILFILFFFCLILYCRSPFLYVWLENDDSWAHAPGIKYISIEKNLNSPAGFFHYLNPYPPGYETVIGLMHQTHPSLYWTMKFFNGFIVAIGYLFFYCLIKEWTRDNTKALLATFCLVCIPCYLTHFIWAHALVVTLFFPAFYTLLKLRDDKRFLWPGSIVIAGIFMTQPTQSIKFCILAAILIAAVTYSRRKLNMNFVWIACLALAISLLWWGPVLKAVQSGTAPITGQTQGNIVNPSNIDSSLLGSLFSPTSGNDTTTYSLEDFIGVPDVNLINGPIGIGIVMCGFALLGLYLCFRRFAEEEENTRTYAITLVFWFVFTFLGVNSATFRLPVGLFAFRFWMLLAIPVSILAAEGIGFILSLLKDSDKKNLYITFIISTVLISSGFNKFTINCDPKWPWGIFWNSYEEVIGFYTLRKNLPANTKVFAFTDNLFVIGQDMRADYWSEEYKKAFSNAIELDVQTLHESLRKNGYEILIISQRDISWHGEDVIEQKVKELTKTKMFKPIIEYKDVIWVYQIL